MCLLSAVLCGMYIPVLIQVTGCPRAPVVCTYLVTVLVLTSDAGLLGPTGRRLLTYGHLQTALPGFVFENTSLASVLVLVYWCMRLSVACVSWFLIVDCF